MNIQILSAAEDDLVDGHAFYERQESGIGNYFSIRSLLKSTPYNSMQVFIARNGANTGCFQNDFHSVFSIHLRKKLCMSVPYVTFEDAHHSCAAKFVGKTEK